MAKLPDDAVSDRLDCRIRRLLAGGKSQRAIAAAVGLSLGAVNQRVAKARRAWKTIQGRTR